MNLPPERLSSVESIFLLGCINTLDMGESSTEYAMLPIFNMIKMANENLASKGYKLIVAYFAGDTPISQSICGLVEGVGKAEYPCRNCYITKDQITEKKNLHGVVQRSINDYRSIPQGVFDKGKSFKGFKSVPKILDVGIFDPILQTPHDIMHILLEGVCRKQIMKILYAWTEVTNKKSRATPSEIDASIQTFNYQYKYAKNKIPQITDYDLKKEELIISAGQMKTLVQLFPFIFSRIIDIDADEYK